LNVIKAILGFDALYFNKILKIEIMFEPTCNEKTVLSHW